MMNMPATPKEHNWTSLCFVISCLCERRIDAGQDDISVLNMESMLLSGRWKAIDLEFVQMARSDLSAD